MTEVAGCGGKNKTLRSLSVASNKSGCSTSSGSDISDVEQLDSGYSINGANEQYPSTTSCTDDSSVDTSEESYDVVSLGVETESFVSGDYSGKLSKIAHSSTIAGSAHSASQAGAKTPKTSKQLMSQPSTVSEDDGARVVVDEMSGVLLSTVEYHSTECASYSGAISKVTYDSLIGSQYGTEVILSAPKVDEPVSNHSPSHASKEPLRKVSARKPRILSNRSRGIVTPSPTKNSITLRRSGAPSREDIGSSPLTKRINPLKLIKAPSSKKQSNS